MTRRQLAIAADRESAVHPRTDAWGTCDERRWRVLRRGLRAPGDAPGALPRRCSGALDDRDLGDLGREVAQAAEQRGIGFGEEPDGAFLVDPVPRLITAEEWRGLEAGLVQRVRALAAFVADAYGERRIVAAGVVPAYVIDSAEYHEPALAGHDALRRRRTSPAWTSCAIATGASWSSRTTSARRRGSPTSSPRASSSTGSCPSPCAGRHGRRWRLRARSTRRCARPRPPDAADPLVAVLTDGPANTAWWEHRTIADRLGPGARRDRGPRRSPATGCTRRIDGRSRRLDVVYRRTSEDRLRGPDGRPTDVGRVLEEPWRRGQVGLVNAFGAGVADDKLAHAYVADMIRFYLGRGAAAALGARPTTSPCPRPSRTSCRASTSSWSSRARAAAGTASSSGRTPTRPTRAATAEAVRRRPEGYVAQEIVPLSRHPTLVDGRLEPRHVDLRAFVFLAGERATALPGGLTRVALDEGALVVNSSQNGGAKDTWVLS